MFQEDSYIYVQQTRMFGSFFYGSCPQASLLLSGASQIRMEERRGGEEGGGGEKKKRVREAVKSLCAKEAPFAIRRVSK